MIAFTTRYADCRMVSKLYPTFFITFDNRFEWITNIRFSNILNAYSCYKPFDSSLQKVGKPRLILDCRHINPHLHKSKFKFEDIKVAEGMFQKGTYYLLML